MPLDRTSWIKLLDRLGPIDRGGHGEGLEEVQDFLTRFGYLDPGHPSTETLDNATVEALARYQEFHALERTGMLDDATRARMQESRCGLPDDPLGFSTLCAWDRRTLSYAFANGTDDIAGTGEQDAVRAAFATWTAAVPSLQFREVAESPDIQIDFRNAADPDHNMVGPVLAHADFPPGCSIITETLPKPLHFDDSENTWCVGAVADQFDVETVALHEIGHLLGLAHTSVAGAVMFASVSAGLTGRVLQPDDLDGIQSLYPTVGWQGPVPFGGSHLDAGAHITPLFQQSPGVFAALSVDASGRANVIWADTNAGGGWQGPVPFGGSHLDAGAHITPLFQQSPGVFAALSVDASGRANVIWADTNAGGGWQGPVPFGGSHLDAGAHITPLFQQSPGVFAALTVDASGRANVIWADTNAGGGWQGPVPFGGSHLDAGAHITPLFQQSPGVFAALTVDASGRANVIWADTNAGGGWQGPVPFGGSHLDAGAHITPLFQQSPGVFAALTVDASGQANVIWADTNAGGGWQGPVPFGGSHLDAGAHITPLFQQSPGVFAALTVDASSQANVIWADTNAGGGWQGPVPFGGSHLDAGAHITPLFQQSPGVFAALTVDASSQANLIWADTNAGGGWQGPVPFGGNHLDAGAHITPLFQQSPGVFAALTVDASGQANVIWADTN